jgi:hypothetical protein
LFCKGKIFRTYGVIVGAHHCFVGAIQELPLEDIKLFGVLTENPISCPKRDSLQKDIGCFRNIRCLKIFVGATGQSPPRF